MKRLKDGSYSWHPHLRTGPPNKDGMLYVQYIKRSARIPGNQVVEALKRVIASRDDVRGFYLQDASNKFCPDGSSYKLGFRSLLKDGKTWYQSQGLRPRPIPEMADSTRVAKIIRDAVPAMDAFRKFSLERLRKAIRKQLAVADPDVHARDLWHNPRDVYRAREQTVRVVLRRRRRLLAMMDASPASTLGDWLLGLDCASFAFAVDTLYGGVVGGDYEYVSSVVRVGGVRTPSVAQFERAIKIVALTRWVHWTWTKPKRHQVTHHHVI
jgi:hypothetical protein